MSTKVDSMEEIRDTLAALQSRIEAQDRQLKEQAEIIRHMRAQSAPRKRSDRWSTVMRGAGLLMTFLLISAMLAIPVALAQGPIDPQAPVDRLPQQAQTAELFPVEVDGTAERSGAGVVPMANGDAVRVASSVSPSDSNGPATIILNPTDTKLIPLMFRIANYSNKDLTLPTNTRTAILGLTAGVDTVAGMTKIGVAGLVDANGYGVYGASATGNGVYGVASGSGGNGVRGVSTMWDGVSGRSEAADGYGVLGVAKSSHGVRGISEGTGAGVLGTGSSGPGVSGTSVSTYGGSFSGGKAPLRLVPNTSITGAPKTGSHLAGELFVDASGNLFYCYQQGTPGRWVQLNNTTLYLPSARK